MGLGFPGGLAACREGVCNKNKQAVPRQSDQTVVMSLAVLLWVGCEALGADSGGALQDARGMQMRHDAGTRAGGADIRKERTSISFPLVPLGNLPPRGLGRLC